MAAHRAEDFARFKQYDYKANSNLVLTAEQRTSAGREPDGSAETLWGKMKGRMGDRVTRERPEGLAGKKPKKREAGGEEGFDMPKRKKGAGGGVSVLDIDTAGLYRPRTKETREAYEALLSVIQGQFGDQPQDVLRGAADEVLASLKNDRITDPARHKEVDSLLGPVPAERFAQLVALGKMITDYAPAEAIIAAGDGEDNVQPGSMRHEALQPSPSERSPSSHSSEPSTAPLPQFESHRTTSHVGSSAAIRSWPWLVESLIV